MKFTLLIFISAWIFYSFSYPNHLEILSTENILITDSCLIKKIVTIAENDSAVLDTSTYVFHYNQNGQISRMDLYYKGGGYLYKVYEYDKKGRIKKITDHYVLKKDAHGFFKGDIANRLQKRFKYRKAEQRPKQVKYLQGTAWERGIRDDQLEYDGIAKIRYNEENGLVKEIISASGGSQKREEFIYDFPNHTVLIKSILENKEGENLSFTMENRYDEIIFPQFSKACLQQFEGPHVIDFIYGNNIIYHKRKNDLDHRDKERRGQVTLENELEIEYNKDGFISKTIRKTINHLDSNKIGEKRTSLYEYTCK